MGQVRWGLVIVWMIGIAVGAPWMGRSSQASSEASRGTSTVWVEAERFETVGGWSVDSQFMDQMGSSFLIAHGMGTPVADAETLVTFPDSGDWFVWIRTRNWVSPWTFPDGVDRIEGVTDPEAFVNLPIELRQQRFPGAFQVSVNGKTLDPILGTRDREWTWESGGTVTIERAKTPVSLRIHDLCGFDGRVDAIVFSRESSPPESDTEQGNSRPVSPVMPAEKTYDLVVVGGGIAGTCAAICAARLGCEVALIQDRPVLGGNGSSEIRVHLNGEVQQPPYPNLGNLTALMGPHGGGNARESAHYKDEERRKLVQAEPRIDLFLNVRVVSVETNGGVTKHGDLGLDTGNTQNGEAEQRGESRRVVAVIGQDVRTGERRAFAGRWFADCTGDGCVGYLAGADWRMGRESRTQTGEGEAPEVADAMTMGASVQWYTEETNEPQRFPELPWAFVFTSESIRPMLRGDWDWENGLNDDQIQDFEKIRDRGLRAAYGHWSYMKNHMEGEWAEKVRNRRLGWVAYVAGKRESRRLLGDVILCQQDIQENREWPDASVTTTWSIDLHYPEKENTKFFPREEFRAVAKQIAIRPYAIPYRCFYSRNVDNLFMAGRDISVTHVALGTVRVMRTGGMMGEVVGMAAAICRNNDCDPRDVYTDHLEELQYLMRKGVALPQQK